MKRALLLFSLFLVSCAPKSNEILRFEVAEGTVLRYKTDAKLEFIDPKLDVKTIKGPEISKEQLDLMTNGFETAIKSGFSTFNQQGEMTYTVKEVAKDGSRLVEINSKSKITGQMIEQVGKLTYKPDGAIVIGDFNIKGLEIPEEQRQIFDKFMSSIKDSLKQYNYNFYGYPLVVNEAHKNVLELGFPLPIPGISSDLRMKFNYSTTYLGKDGESYKFKHDILIDKFDVEVPISESSAGDGLSVHMRGGKSQGNLLLGKDGRILNSDTIAEMPFEMVIQNKIGESKLQITISGLMKQSMKQILQ